ncbi:MAG: hypothetical protein LBM65_05675 [Oscillospiraceae bacterium]|jgi:two-component system phosphate regulon sensor histidine kinase PhoR|nr:hypothetical protein [Oscillospiraceae bacterium]
MKKKIFKNIALVSSVCVLLTGVFLCLVFYFQLGDVVKTELQNRANAYIDFSYEDVENSLADVDESDIRVTLVAPNGTVVFDNTANATTLENHTDRIEIKEALESGSGQSSRLSQTLGEETYYYAVKLSDGYILRTAKTADSVLAVFARNLLLFALIMLAVLTLCYCFSARLAKRIVAPINKINFDEPNTVYDELAPFMRTITSQRSQIEKDMQALRARQDTINTIMDNMSEGAVLVDNKENLLYVNKGAKKLFSFANNGQGQNLRALFRDAELLAVAKSTLSGEHCETNRNIGGREYQIYGSPVAGVGAILLFVDVTEKAKAEKLRREFSANVSHELKTPLTSIAGYAELLTNGVAKQEDTAGFLQKIKAESDRLSQLVEDIMLLSGLDEGQATANIESVELAKVAYEVKELLAKKTEKNAVKINITAADDVIIKANYSHMHQLLFNLMENAVKYNKSGGTVEVSIQQKNGHPKLTVADTGIGIPTAEQARIFERFYRVDKSRSKTLGGTGLGLAIVKHICMIYEAKIDVKSTEEKGTKISVTF